MRPRDIFVFCRDLKKYDACCEELIPQMERTHRIEFEKINRMFYNDYFRIMPLIRMNQITGRREFEIHKFGDWELNPESEEIDDYVKRKLGRKIPRPVTKNSGE